MCICVLTEGSKTFHKVVVIKVEKPIVYTRQFENGILSL